VFLAVLAERFFGFHLGRRQWAGMTLTAAGLAVIGLTATAEGPQRSSLAALIAVESAILGGILVFGEPIGSGAIGIIARLLAFCLVIAGAALVPAPLRATSNST
jgi:drug/metabolite transporter (DMT)-like permease